MGTTHTPSHLRTIGNQEDSVHALLQVLREEGIDTVRNFLWDATGWRRDYSPTTRRNRATEEQKRMGWEMAVRIEKILCTVLDEAHEQQVREVIETLSEGPEEFYRRPS